MSCRECGGVKGVWRSVDGVGMGTARVACRMAAAPLHKPAHTSDVNSSFAAYAHPAHVDMPVKAHSPLPCCLFVFENRPAFTILPFCIRNPTHLPHVKLVLPNLKFAVSAKLQAHSTPGSPCTQGLQSQPASHAATAPFTHRNTPFPFSTGSGRSESGLKVVLAVLRPLRPLSGRLSVGVCGLTAVTGRSQNAIRAFGRWRLQSQSSLRSLSDRCQSVRRLVFTVSEQP
eukprot:184458-Chlamydomonas_euryale.AAC.5